jgi:hypothetical protein
MVLHFTGLRHLSAPKQRYTYLAPESGERSAQ